MKHYRYSVNAPIEAQMTQVSESAWPNIVRITIQGSNPGIRIGDVVTYTNGKVMFSGKVKHQTSGSNYKSINGVWTQTPTHVVGVEHPNPSDIGNLSGGELIIGLPKTEPSPTGAPVDVTEGAGVNMAGIGMPGSKTLMYVGAGILGLVLLNKTFGKNKK